MYNYFADDIVSNFKRFLEKAFGNEKLIENMNYIADILGKKGTETSEDTLMKIFRKWLLPRPYKRMEKDLFIGYLIAVRKMALKH